MNLQHLILKKFYRRPSRVLYRATIKGQYHYYHLSRSYDLLLAFTPVLSTGGCQGSSKVDNGICPKLCSSVLIYSLYWLVLLVLPAPQGTSRQASPNDPQLFSSQVGHLYSRHPLSPISINSTLNFTYSRNLIIISSFKFYLDCLTKSLI